MDEGLPHWFKSSHSSSKDSGCVEVAYGGTVTVLVRDTQNRGAAVVLGLVVVLFVSGLIEGLVTGWITSTWVAIGIGVVAEVLFFVYVFTVGRKAYLEGETGDIENAPAAVPVAG